MGKSNYEKWIPEKWIPLPNFEFVNKYDIDEFLLGESLQIILIADDFFHEKKMIIK